MGMLVSVTEREFLHQMREPSNKEKIEKFMEVLGHRAKKQGRVYLTGGATAVLLDWRDTTIDIDIKPVPETDEIFQAIAALKLIRYPAIDPEEFETKVREVIQSD